MKKVIYRVYRPSSFSAIHGQEHVQQTVQNQIKQDSIAHAYLFSGPRGVGKTTIARLIAKAANCLGRQEGDFEPCNQCEHCLAFEQGAFLDIVEIDAASNTGVDNVRENIIDSVRFAPNKGKFKVFIIDEVHMLSTSAFNALLKTLEEPPAHIIFILATTEIHKIPATIISRCQRFDFRRIPVEKMVEKLGFIAKEEGVKIDEITLKRIARLSEGCLRDAENLLGQLLSIADQEVTKEMVDLVLPESHIEIIFEILTSLAGGDLKNAMVQLNQLVDEGKSMRHFIDEFIFFLRSLLFLKINPDHPVIYGDEMRLRMKELSQKMTSDQLTDLLDQLLAARVKPTQQALPHLPIEIVFSRFCKISLDNQNGEQGNDQSLNTEGKKKVVNPPEKKVVNKESALEKQEQDPGSQQKAEAVSILDISLQNIQNKWGRCIKAVAKRSVSLPMALQTAQPQALDGSIVTIVFESSFHFDAMKQQKNKLLLEEAMKEVLNCEVSITCKVEEKEKEEEVATNFIEALGGSLT